MKYNKVINALEGFSKNVEARMQSKDSGTLPILTLEILPQIEASFYKAFSGEASKVDDAMNGFLALDDILEKNLSNICIRNTQYINDKQFCNFLSSQTGFKYSVDFFGAYENFPIPKSERNQSWYANQYHLDKPNSKNMLKIFLPISKSCLSKD